LNLKLQFLQLHAISQSMSKAFYASRNKEEERQLQPPEVSISVNHALARFGLHALKQVAKEVGLNLGGAYVNLDGGFDSAHNRKCIFNAGLIPNIKEPPQPQASQARLQTPPQRRHPCLTPVRRADLCVGGQIQAAVAPL
jgi:hypothetical protein